MLAEDFVELGRDVLRDHLEVFGGRRVRCANELLVDDLALPLPLRKLLALTLPLWLCPAVVLFDEFLATFWRGSGAEAECV